MGFFEKLLADSPDPTTVRTEADRRFPDRPDMAEVCASTAFEFLYAQQREALRALVGSIAREDRMRAERMRDELAALDVPPLSEVDPDGEDEEEFGGESGTAGVDDESVDYGSLPHIQSDPTRHDLRSAMKAPTEAVR